MLGDRPSARVFALCVQTKRQRYRIAGIVDPVAETQLQTGARRKADVGRDAGHAGQATLPAVAVVDHRHRDLLPVGLCDGLVTSQPAIARGIRAGHGAANRGTTERAGLNHHQAGTFRRSPRPVECVRSGGHGRLQVSFICKMRASMWRL